MTRILGVDPGLTRLGVGVIDHSRGRDVSLVMVEVFTTPTDWDVAKRLLSLQGQLREVLDEFQPARVSLERVFAQHNVRTVMGTAQVSGIVLALAAERGIPVAHRTPSEVKAAVTGFGGAKKPQVGQMVKNYPAARPGAKARRRRRRARASDHRGLAGKSRCGRGPSGDPRATRVAGGSPAPRYLG